MKQKPAETPASEATVPITKAELLLLQDVASGLVLLQMIEKGTDGNEIRIGNVGWIIRKIADPLWELAHDDLWSRWDKLNPKAKLFEEKE